MSFFCLKKKKKAFETNNSVLRLKFFSSHFELFFVWALYRKILMLLLDFLLTTSREKKFTFKKKKKKEKHIDFFFFIDVRLFINVNTFVTMGQYERIN